MFCLNLLCRKTVPCKLVGEFCDIGVPEDYNLIQNKIDIKWTVNYKKFIVSNDASLKHVLEIVDLNTLGTVFVSNQSGQLLGSISDGDIRRYLLADGTLDDLAVLCMNPGFCFATNDTSTEILTKYFDNFRVVPLLDERGVVLDFYIKNTTDLVSRERLYSRSKTPVRISFAGGGSDLTYFFSQGHEASVVNATIKKFSYAMIQKRSDEKIHINSFDLLRHFVELLI